MINDRNSESGGWSLAGDRGDSEQVVGGHWQKTEETMTMVGWPLAGDRGDSDKVMGWSQAEDRGDNDNVGWPLAGDRGDSEKVVGGHWQKTEETVKSGGVATGRRQRRQ